MPPAPPRNFFLPYLLACAALAAFYQPLPPALEENIRNIPQGLFFGYGLAPVVQHPPHLSMPMSPVLNFLIYLLPSGADAHIWPAFYLCTGLLAFALAAELTASAWAGACAAAFAALALSLRVPRMLCTPEQMLYAVACSLAAYVLMRRAVNPRSAKTELGAGAAIGLTLFIKSPLFLLPFALAAWDILSGRLKRGETNWKLLSLLCLVPYAMLLPWTCMHYSLNHTLLLLEGNRANQNMITGALGIVFTLEGAYPLANLPDNGSVLLWAVKTVATHPLTFAGGVLRRLYSLFVWYPVAAAGLAAATLRFRNDRRFQALLSLLAYYVSIHCLLSIQERYFIPIWTIGLAGAAAIFFPPRTLPQPTQPAKLAGAIAAAFFALLAALYLFTAALLVSYPHRAKANGHKLQSPQHASAPILALMSEQALSEDDMATTETYARTALLSRQSNLERCAYFYMLIAKGIDISRPMKNFPLRMDTPHDRREASYLRLANALRQERDITEDLRQAFLDWRFADASFRAITSLEESQLQKTQMADTSDFSKWALPRLVRRFPQRLRPEMISRLMATEYRSQALTQLLMETLLREPFADVSGQTLRHRRLFPSTAAYDKNPKTFHGVINEYWKLRPLSPLALNCLYKELQILGLNTGNLKEFTILVRRHPNVQRRFQELERLHETKQYTALIQPAEEYLRDYPYDQVATLFLAVAYLNTGKLKQAKNSLEKAEALPLEPQEKQWLSALRLNYAKEITVKGE